MEIASKTTLIIIQIIDSVVIVVVVVVHELVSIALCLVRLRPALYACPVLGNSVCRQWPTKRSTIRPTSFRTVVVVEVTVFVPWYPVSIYI